MTYKGDNAALGYKIETAFDETPVESAQTTWIGIVPNLDLNDEVEWKEFRTINGSRDRFSEAQGKISVSGSIPTIVQNGRAIYLAMGSISETDDGLGTYTHTITGGTTIPSICLEATYKGTNQFLRYYRGLKIDSLEIEGTDGGEVKGAISFMCARSQKSTNTISTITNVTTTPMMYYNGAMTIDSYADFNITTWKWKISNNLKPRHTVRTTDGQYAKLIIEGTRDYEMSANVIIPDAATYNTKLYDMLIAGTLFTTSVSLIRTADTDEMVLTASNCVMKSAPHNIPEAGNEVEISITFSPRTCTWVVKDAITTYE